MPRRDGGASSALATVALLGAIAAAGLAAVVTDDELRTRLAARWQWQCCPADAEGTGPCIRTSLSGAEADVLRTHATGQDVLEIGAAYGFSTVAMALVARSVTSVDPHDTLDSLGEFTANLAAYGVADLVTVVEGFSDDFCPLAPPGSFGFVFIDGAHTYEATLHDLDCATALLAHGGWVALHDWARLAAVRAAAAAWVAEPPTLVVDSLALWQPGTA